VGPLNWGSYIRPKHKKMELLYFIGGILSVGVVYGVILLRTVKSSHTELLDTFTKSQYISSTRRTELRDELEDLKVLIKDIQTNMEKDQYENLSTINKRIEELNTTTYDNTDQVKNLKISVEQGLSEAYRDIQQLKNNIKALGQDPNMLSRY